MLIKDERHCYFLKVFATSAQRIDLLPFQVENESLQSRKGILTTPLHSNKRLSHSKKN